MRPPKGYTLIELAVSMSAGSTVLILAIGLLHQSMSLASHTRATSDHQRSVQRLSKDFRSDVHGATKCVVTRPDHVRIVMTGGAEVQYAADGNSVRRNQLLDGQSVRRESYPCAAGTSVKFDTLSDPDLAVLTVTAQPHRSVDQYRLDRVVSAVVGRRLAHETGGISP